MLPIVKGNNKTAILNALISSNDEIWQAFNMHPLSKNMRLMVAASARERGGVLSIDEMEQLDYADMLIDVSNNHNSKWCQVLDTINKDTCTLGLPLLNYFIGDDHDKAVEWLHPEGNLDFSATVLSSTNEIVDMWNAVAQDLNPNEAHVRRSKDTFSEADDVNGHTQKMISSSLINGLKKSGVPNHELTLKVGDICLIARAIPCLEIANNSQVKIVNIRTHSVEVKTIGEETARTIPLPRIPFKFRLKYGNSYQLTRMQFPLRVAYAMTYNKSQSQTLVKVLLDIKIPPFSHGQLYVTLSRVRDSKKIAMYVRDDQLVQSMDAKTGYMPTIDNIAYQEVLKLNC